MPPDWVEIGVAAGSPHFGPERRRETLKAHTRSSGSRFQIIPWLCLAVTTGLPVSLVAQGPAGAGSGKATLPDSPQPKHGENSSPVMDTTTRFVGYMSNKSIAFPDIATSPGPMTSGQKFKLFVNQSISPAYLVAAGISAAYGQAREVPQAYGEGWEGYGNRYGAAVARASSNAFFSTYVLGSAFHHDPRFFPQSRPTFWGSVKYSAEKIVISRNDEGDQVLNSSGLLGPLLAEGLANAYLPVSEQTLGKTFERYGTDTAWKFAANMFKNYWPTIFHRYRLNRLVILPAPSRTRRRPAHTARLTPS